MASEAIGRGFESLQAHQRVCAQIVPTLCPLLKGSSGAMSNSLCDTSASATWVMATTLLSHMTRPARRPECAEKGIGHSCHTGLPIAFSACAAILIP